MFKKILSFALILAVLMSVAMIAASAAETDVADDAADAPEETGAARVITFDPSGTGWGNTTWIAFHIWSINDPECVGFGWGAKDQRGTKNADGTWSYDLDKAYTKSVEKGKNLVIREGYQYAVIFYNNNDSQTYNLLFGASCIGLTAYCDGTQYENPVDSTKKGLAAFWKGISSSTYGPELKITSIGNVVGTCFDAGSTAYTMFDDFLKNTLANAQEKSGKDDQKLIDDTAAALGMGREDVADAIAAAGVSLKWSADKSNLPEKSSAPTTPTGQDSTPIYVMIAVMVAAAGVIFFLRRRARG